MAFQFVNYAGLPTEGLPALKNALKDFMSGYSMSQIPGQLSRQKQQEELINALKSLQVQEEPQKFASEMRGRDLMNQLRALEVQQNPEKFDLFKKLSNAKLQRYLEPAAMEYTKAEKLNQAILRAKEQFGEDSDEYKRVVGYANKLAGLNTGNVSRGTNREGLTTSTITANQKALQAIDNALPLIKELQELKVPNQFLASLPMAGKYAYPDKQAAYHAKAAEITDTLMSALKLPMTTESLNLVGSMVRRAPTESEAAYNKRLKGLEKNLMRRKQSLSSSGMSNPSKVFNLANGEFE